MIKQTVLYEHSAEPTVLEKYYEDIHAPIAQKMTGMEKVELTKFLDAPDGSKQSHYRMAGFWFTSPEALNATTSSPEGQAAVNDLQNFVTGGVEFLVGVVES